MKRSAFTLIELLISIALFAIITIFLYQTLDMNEKSNIFYEQKLESYQNADDLKFIIYEDILNNSENNETKLFKKDKNDNTILRLNTSNTFHNPFYANVTYFLGKEGELFRIESKEFFNPEAVYDVLKKSYVDVIYTGVEKFRVVKKAKEKDFALYILFTNGEKIFITVSSPKS